MKAFIKWNVDVVGDGLLALLLWLLGLGLSLLARTLTLLGRHFKRMGRMAMSKGKCLNVNDEI